MNTLLQVNLTCFLLSYVVAFVVEVVQFVRARSRMGHTVALLVMAAGLLAHTLYLIARFQKSGLPPLVGSSHDWLLVLAWLGIAMSLILTVMTQVSQAIFLLPVVLILVLAAIFVDATPADIARQAEERRWTMLHASSLAVGIGLVVTATGAALMYLLQFRRLRGHTMWIRRLRLPSLERLTSVNRWLVVACIPLLTIGLITGVVLATFSEGGTFRLSEPIVWGTIVVWLMMVVRLVFLLRRRKATGRTVAHRTLLAGGFLCLTIFGLTLVTGGIHGSRTSTPRPEFTTPPRS